ncbi:MAG: hypothetical protein RI973_2358, partial [Bacteroidota bacterium]
LVVFFTVIDHREVSEVKSLGIKARVK